MKLRIKGKEQISDSKTENVRGKSLILPLIT